MNINHEEKREVYLNSYKKHLHMIELYKTKLIPHYHKNNMIASPSSNFK